MISLVLLFFNYPSLGLGIVMLSAQLGRLLTPSMRNVTTALIALFVPSQFIFRATVLYLCTELLWCAVTVTMLYVILYDTEWILLMSLLALSFISYILSSTFVKLKGSLTDWHRSWGTFRCLTPLLNLILVCTWMKALLDLKLSEQNNAKALL